MSNEQKNRLFIKVTHDTLPQIKDRYPFLYLERGRLEIDDSSVKWIDSEKNCIKLPIATICTLLLGPGTSVTHEAVKILASSNCTVCWVGEDSMMFYAVGKSPTANTRNLKHQMLLSSDSKKALIIARKMFMKRFPNEEVKNKTLSELMGMEGLRVKKLYEQMADTYKVGWKGRAYTPGKFDFSDITNKILTSSNAALYAIITSVVYSMGYSPHIGFIHSGSPLPFVYDIADFYKDNICIDLSFSLTLEMAGNYNKDMVVTEFRRRVIKTDLLKKIGTDINELLW